MSDTEELDVQFIHEHGDSIMSSWQLSEALRRMARKTKNVQIKNTFAFMEDLLIKSLYNTMIEEGSKKKLPTSDQSAFNEDIKQVFGTRELKGSGIVDDLNKAEWLKLFPTSLGYLCSGYTGMKFRCASEPCGELHTLAALNVYYDFASAPHRFFVGFHHLVAPEQYKTPYEFLQTTIATAIFFRNDDGLDHLYGFDMTRNPEDKVGRLVANKSLVLTGEKHSK